MKEDKLLKPQFTVKDHVGSLGMDVENMTGRLDSNPNPSGDILSIHATRPKTSYTLSNCWDTKE